MKKLVLVFFVMILSTVSMAKVVLKCQSAVSEMPYFEVEVDTKVGVGPVPEPPMPAPLHKSCNYDNFSVEVKKTMDGHNGAITIMKSFKVTDFLPFESSAQIEKEYVPPLNPVSSLSNNPEASAKKVAVTLPFFKRVKKASG